MKINAVIKLTTIAKTVAVHAQAKDHHPPEETGWTVYAPLDVWAAAEEEVDEVRVYWAASPKSLNW